MALALIVPKSISPEPGLFLALGLEVNEKDSVSKREIEDRESPITRINAKAAPYLLLFIAFSYAHHLPETYPELDFVGLKKLELYFSFICFCS